MCGMAWLLIFLGLGGALRDVKAGLINRVSQRDMVAKFRGPAKATLNIKQTITNVRREGRISRLTIIRCRREDVVRPPIYIGSFRLRVGRRANATAVASIRCDAQVTTALFPFFGLEQLQVFLDMHVGLEDSFMQLFYGTVAFRLKSC